MAFSSSVHRVKRRRISYPVVESNIAQQELGEGHVVPGPRLRRPGRSPNPPRTLRPPASAKSPSATAWSPSTVPGNSTSATRPRPCHPRSTLGQYLLRRLHLGDRRPHPKDRVLRPRPPVTSVRSPVSSHAEMAKR